MQRSHAVAFVDGAKEPGAHASHAEALAAGEALPAVHIVGATLPLAQALPGGQVRQSPCDAMLVELA